MYLISIYFDENTNKKIQAMMDKVAEMTGNGGMKDVPPHITISAFEIRNESVAVDALKRAAVKLKSGNIQWASVGQFFPSVLFITPVLNQYLQYMANVIFEEIAGLEGIKISAHYQPFSWHPHTTIGKRLSANEMRKAVEVMQESFQMLEGTVVKIGLAKPNPHRDIMALELLVK